MFDEGDVEGGTGEEAGGEDGQGFGEGEGREHGVGYFSSVLMLWWIWWSARVFGSSGAEAQCEGILHVGAEAPTS
jgi:hypothetical protein